MRSSSVAPPFSGMRPCREHERTASDLLRMSTLSAKNISLKASGKSPLEAGPSRLHPEGRIAVVTNVERGMRWTRRRQLTSDGFADGEVVWFWRPDAGVKLAR